MILLQYSGSFQGALPMAADACLALDSINGGTSAGTCRADQVSPAVGLVAVVLHVVLTTRLVVASQENVQLGSNAKD